MEIAIFPPQELPTALGTLRELLPANHPLRDRMVWAIARLHRASFDLASLPAPSAAETADVIRDPVRRKRLVQLAVVSTLIGGERGPSLEAALCRLCQTLGVDTAVLRAGRSTLAASAASWTAAASGGVP